MKSLCLISSLLALCSLAPAQSARSSISVVHGDQRPRTTVPATQLYLANSVAGTGGSYGYTGDGGPANLAEIYNPLAVAVDAQGDYFISDYYNNRIREVVAATGNIMTIAGTGTPGFSGDGGPAIDAQFSVAHGLAVDAKGNIYIADGPNARVRVINSAGVINTLAGNGTYGWTGDGGPATSAALFYPSGVAVDSIGNVFIADFGNSTVRMVSAATGVITTVAGYGVTGFGNFPGNGGPGFQDLLGLPYAVAVDESGNVYIADVGTSSIRKVGRDGIIYTVVANVSSGGLATDPAGNLYYSDYDNNVINKLLPDNTVVTIAGTGSIGYQGDGGPGLETEFDGAYGIAIDSSGDIYVADYSNQVIRQLKPVAPPGAFVINGASDLYNTIAAGEVVSIFGNSIGFQIQATAQPDASGLFEKQFAGTAVTFNGIPAPILISGPTYVSAVVPYELAGASVANVVVTQNGQITGTQTVPVSASSPGLFSATSTGILNGLAPLNSNGGVITSANAPAETSNITLFVTGEGPTTPAGIDGLVSGSSNSPLPLLPVSVTIGGSPATVVSAVEAPGQVAGVLQIVATLPAAVTTSSAVLIQVQVGTAQTQQINIPVQ